MTMPAMAPELRPDAGAPPRALRDVVPSSSIGSATDDVGTSVDDVVGTEEGLGVDGAGEGGGVVRREGCAVDGVVVGDAVGAKVGASVIANVGKMVGNWLGPSVVGANEVVGYPVPPLPPDGIDMERDIDMLLAPPSKPISSRNHPSDSSSWTRDSSRWLLLSRRKRIPRVAAADVGCWAKIMVHASASNFELVDVVFMVLFGFDCVLRCLPKL